MFKVAGIFGGKTCLPLAFPSENLVCFIERNPFLSSISYSYARPRGSYTRDAVADFMLILRKSYSNRFNTFLQVKKSRKIVQCKS